MISRTVTGFSSESASAALSMALSQGSGGGANVASVQVIILGVHHTEKGWTASAVILMEPKAEPHHSQPDMKNPKQELDEEHEKERLKLLLEHDFEMQRHTQERIHQIDLEAEEALSSLYMDAVLEMTYHPIAPNFDFDYVHFVPKGPLWDEVLKHHPHLDMYEATHDVHENDEDELEDENEPETPKNLRRFKLIPKPNYKRKGEEAA